MRRQARYHVPNKDSIIDAASETFINKLDLVGLSMVNALIKLNDETNKVLNIVKAQNGLKDKGEAVEFVVHRYLEEPELKTEFVQKIKKIEKQKSIRVKDFEQRYDI